MTGLDLSFWSGHQSEVMMAAQQHISLTLKTIGFSLLIALPLGTLVARVRFLYTPILGFFGIVYTIPSLALFAAFQNYVGLGETNAIIVLVAYAQFILIRNVAVGLRQVDAAVIEAARGMGMNSWQILLKIEYPLALPVILAGLRIATVATIAIATLATLIDAGGIGSILFEGISRGYYSEIEVGALAVSILAVSADVLLRLADLLIPASRARAAAR